LVLNQNFVYNQDLPLKPEGRSNQTKVDLNNPILSQSYATHLDRLLC